MIIIASSLVAQHAVIIAILWLTLFVNNNRYVLVHASHLDSEEVEEKGEDAKVNVRAVVADLEGNAYDCAVGLEGLGVEEVLPCR